MPIQPRATYVKDGRFVKIIFPIGEAVHMDESTLKLVIENIQRSEKKYADQDSYREALSIYQNALNFLKGN